MKSAAQSGFIDIRALCYPGPALDAFCDARDGVDIVTKDDDGNIIGRETLSTSDKEALMRRVREVFGIEDD